MKKSKVLVLFNVVVLTIAIFLVGCAIRPWISAGKTLGACMAECGISQSAVLGTRLGGGVEISGAQIGWPGLSCLTRCVGPAGAVLVAESFGDSVGASMSNGSAVSVGGYKSACGFGDKPTCNILVWTENNQ